MEGYIQRFADGIELGYIIYYYLYGWFSISVSGIGFFSAITEYL